MNSSHTWTHPSKGVQKKWDFTENKPRHRCFNTNLQKVFRTNILVNATEQILLIVVLMIELCLDN